MKGDRRVCEDPKIQGSGLRKKDRCCPMWLVGARCPLPPVSPAPAWPPLGGQGQEAVPSSTIFATFGESP